MFILLPNIFPNRNVSFAGSLYQVMVSMLFPLHYVTFAQDIIYYWRMCTCMNTRVQREALEEFPVSAQRTDNIYHISSPNNSKIIYNNT